MMGLHIDFCMKYSPNKQIHIILILFGNSDLSADIFFNKKFLNKWKITEKNRIFVCF